VSPGDAQDLARVRAKVRVHQADLTHQLEMVIGGFQQAIFASWAGSRAQEQLAEYDAHSRDVGVLLAEAHELLTGVERAGTLLRAAAALHAGDVADAYATDLVTAPASRF
jgi:hypothetical protein